MKILTAQEIRTLDQYTIINQPVLSIDLMERAAKGVKRWLDQNLNPKTNFHIFCGTGNNGGDGLALARLLKKEGRNVEAHLVKYSKNLSLECATNEKSLKEYLQINYIETEKDFPTLEEGDVIIDAIFGSGFNRAAEGISKEIITYINSKETPIVSIDIPSGMFCNNLSPEGEIVQADITLSFQLPKLAFLVPENEDYVGQWTVLDIGLSAQGLEQSQNTYNYILQNEAKQIIQAPSKFSHKGTNGHGLLIAGSKGKSGAAVLAAKGALRSGLGLLTVAIPECNYNSLASIPEAMCTTQGENYNTTLPTLDTYTHIAIGPGLGVTDETKNLLAELLNHKNSPMVIDADAINILSENNDLIERLPKYSILTPHPREFDRLVGESTNTFERLEKALAFAIDHEVIVVLKGAHTAIAIPSGQIFFNSSGNPGMSTAGCGDVLSGMLLGLLCQGYHPVDASVLGVFLHGLAGDVTTQTQSYESLLASDIVHNLGMAFKVLLDQLPKKQ